MPNHSLQRQIWRPPELSQASPVTAHPLMKRIFGLARHRDLNTVTPAVHKFAYRRNQVCRQVLRFVMVNAGKKPVGQVADISLKFEQFSPAGAEVRRV